jgi:hypothetical protein
VSVNAAPAVLLAALLAPLAGLVPAFGPRDLPGAGRWLHAGLAASLLAWLALLVLGWPARLGALAPDRLGLAAGAALALVALAAGRPRSPAWGAVVGPAVTLVATCACLTIDGDPSVAAVMAALAGVVVVVAVVQGRPTWAEAVAAAGIALVAVAIRVLEGTEATSGPLAVLVLGCATLVAVGAAGRHAPAVLLVPGAVLVGLRIVLPAGSIDGLAVAALVVAAVAAGVTAFAPVARRMAAAVRSSSPASVLAVSALAAALLPFTDAEVAAVLLAEAAVLATVLPPGLAPLAALPGTAVVVAGLGEDGTVAISAALLALAIGVALGRAAAERGWSLDDRPVPAWPHATGLAVAGWLVVVPESWSLTGPPVGLAVERYQEGILVAVAAGLIAVVAALAVAARRGTPPVGWGAWLAGPEPSLAGPSAGPWPTVVTVTLLGMATALLLPSLVP